MILNYEYSSQTSHIQPTAQSQLRLKRRLLHVSPPGHFSTRLFPTVFFPDMRNSTRACKTFQSLTDHSEDYCRNYGRNLVKYFAMLNYLSCHLEGWQRPVVMLQSHRCRVGTQPFPFEVQLCRRVQECVCVCAAVTITGWVANRNNNFDHAETARMKLNARTLYDIGICPNLCWLQCICWEP